MNSIILENRFTLHQKTHLLLFMASPILLVIVVLAQEDLNVKGFSLLIFLFVLYCLIVLLSFTKKGFLKKNGDLYRGLFFLKYVVYKKKIALSEWSKISILSFRKSQKMAWFSAANPDIADNFNSSDINLLNDKHTRRETLVSLMNNALAQKAVAFLEENFKLKYEIYNPDFS